MTDDLISRQAAMDVIDKIFPVDPMRNDYTQGIACGAALAKTYVEQLPSAQPERTRGKWKKGVGENGVTTSLFCSECNYENTSWYDWNYCPNCGAKMERSEE